MYKKKRTFLHRKKNHKFGELLVSNGSITPEHLDEALAIQREAGGLLGDIMVNKGFITETDVVHSLCTQYGLPVMRAADYEIDKDLIELFPPEFLYVNMVLPLGRIEDLLLVLAADLPDDAALDLLEGKDREVVLYITSNTDLSTALARTVPVSEDERREYISRRRRKFIASGLDTQDAETGATVFECAEGGGMTGTLDSAWESIFDEAEENVKRGDG